MARTNPSANAFFALSALFALAVVPGASGLDGAAGKESDAFDTGSGELKITFLGHASLVLEFGGRLIYIDPVKQYGDFSRFPKADLILVTHEHGDHLDAGSIAALKTPSTRIVLNESSRRKLGEGETLEHGKVLEAAGVSVKAVPAYNVTAGRANYHPKERGDNGYVITVGSLRVYVAGDTEPTPEMARMGPVDIAFLPMNLPYTMTPDQVATAARTIKPNFLYPYHFGTTDTGSLAKLLAGEPGIQIRLRKLQ
ncbi:MAG TPA: MBL fold metallo-hydrolase [Rectinemataceae bacterium]|nr:MBL fold metallo-hydrolase [Rectinemataceae bacterium]